MNKHKNIKLGILTILLALFMTSCSKEFLKENNTSDYNYDQYNTDEGLNALAVSLYANLRYHFAYEWAYATTQYGCDEFSVGTDLTSEPWNTYDSRLGAYTIGANSNTPKPENLWDQMYYGIKLC